MERQCKWCLKKSKKGNDFCKNHAVFEKAYLTATKTTLYVVCKRCGMPVVVGKASFKREKNEESGWRFDEVLRVSEESVKEAGKVMKKKHSKCSAKRKLVFATTGGKEKKKDVMLTYGVRVKMMGKDGE